MATLESLGLGSGVLTTDLVEKLIKAEREVTENRLDMRQELTEAKITAYGEINSRLSQMQDAAIALSSPTLSSGTTAKSSNDTILGATTGLGAEPGVYEVEVKNTAKAHSLASGTYSSMDAVVGTGTLTFTFGELEYDDDGNITGQNINSKKAPAVIEIGESNRTLTGIRDAINKADAGVRASIVNDGTGYRLQLTSSETGKENAMRVVATDANGVASDSGLGALAYNEQASYGFEQVSKADDARISVNGLDIVRASNDIDEVIRGVTLNLKNADINNKVTITVEADLEALTGTIESFIEAYNELKEFVDDLSKYDADSKTGGLLMGDSAVRSMMDDLRRMISMPIVGVGGKYRSLTELGVNSDKDKNFLLKFNKETFNKAMTENRGDVITLLSKGGEATDGQITYMNDSVNTQPGSYDVVITQLATQAKYQGSRVMDFTNPVEIDSTNNQFEINVNGVAVVVNLTQGSYASGDDLAKEIALQINSNKTLSERDQGVTVEYVDGRFDITSNLYGSASKIYISKSTPGASNTLGLAPQGAGAYQGLGVDGLGADAFANGGLTLSEDVTFKIEVDGVTSGVVVNVAAGTYATPEDLENAIQAAIADMLADSNSGFGGVESSAAVGPGTVNLSGVDFGANQHGFSLTVNGVTEEIVIDGSTAGANNLEKIQNALDAKFTGDSRVIASLDGDGKLSLATEKLGADQSIIIASDGRGARTQLGTEDLSSGSIDFAANPAKFDLVVAGVDISVNVDSDEGDTLVSIQKALDAALVATGAFDKSDVIARLDEDGKLYFETWRKQMSWGPEVTGSQATVEIKSADANAMSSLGIVDGMGLKGYDSIGLKEGTQGRGDDLTPKVSINQADGKGSLDIVLGSLGKKIRFTELSDNAGAVLGLQDKAFYSESVAQGKDVEGTIDGVKAQGEGQYLRGQSGTEAATNGYYLGNELSSFPVTLNSTNNKFTVNVDGTEAEITVATGNYTTGKELAAAVQAAFDNNATLNAQKLGVKVEFTTDENSANFNKLSMISGSTGSRSEVRIVGAEADNAFGFVTGAGGGERGKEKRGADSGADGIRIKVTGGNLGDRGTVSFISGVGDQLRKMLGGFLTGSNSLMKIREGSFNRELSTIKEERERLNMRIDATETRLKRSFQYNDAIVAKLNSTLDFVKMQFEAMNQSKK